MCLCERESGAESEPSFAAAAAANDWVSIRRQRSERRHLAEPRRPNRPIDAGDANGEAANRHDVARSGAGLTARKSELRAKWQIGAGIVSELELPGERTHTHTHSQTRLGSSCIRLADIWLSNFFALEVRRQPQQQWLHALHCTAGVCFWTQARLLYRSILKAVAPISERPVCRRRRRRCLATPSRKPKLAR